MLYRKYRFFNPTRVLKTSNDADSWPRWSPTKMRSFRGCFPGRGSSPS